MKVKPLAFDSFGVRSMATCVETGDVKLVIDPGVSLAPIRYGLPPHPSELQRMEECWELIKAEVKDSNILILTHYHYDHHDPSEPEIYEGKTTYIKHPTEKINFSQKQRAAYFLDVLKGCPRHLEFADGKEFEHGKTKIKFSPPVCHGTNPRLGYVTEVSMACGGEKFLFTSDVEGPSLPDQTQFILDEKPDTLILDGPMTYMLGFRYSYKSLQTTNENLVRIINGTPVQVLMLEHHFMRDLKYVSRIKPVYDAARDKGVKVTTAAEFLGREIEMLEARRKELFEKPGEMGVPERVAKRVFEE